MRKTCLLLTIMCSVFILVSSHAQIQTVGLFENSEDAYNGYTLFSPVADTRTYLIDNCGHELRRWEFDQVPGMMAYLLEDGSVLRASRLFEGFGAGGSGGLIEMRSWEDELLWSFAYSSDSIKQHHDLEYLPNGNVLIISWERRPDDEIIQAGRIPESIGSSGLWMEQIVELRPIGIDSAEIVWEWHLYDHLVQDVNPSLSNFGDIASSPERIDINFRAFNDAQLMTPGSADWLHFNGIDYNEELDLIIISSRNTNEIYVIDHSTSTAEAAGSSGGNFGKGGDILFRYGNDNVFNPEDTRSQTFYAQHDASWVKRNGEFTGEISVFNNGLGRTGNISSVEIIRPEIQNNSFSFDTDMNKYVITENWQLFANDQFPFSSPRISGVQVLDNDNVLVCSGNHGTFYEFNRQGGLEWLYVNPISQTGPLPQGVNPVLNDVFRSLRYSVDYPAFEGRTLEQGDLLELDPVEIDCTIYDGMTSSNLIAGSEIDLYPNPSSGFLYVKDDTGIMSQANCIVYDQYGRQVYTCSYNYSGIDITELAEGIYYLRILAGAGSATVKFVKY